MHNIGKREKDESIKRRLNLHGIYTIFTKGKERQKHIIYKYSRQQIIQTKHKSISNLENLKINEINFPGLEI